MDERTHGVTEAPAPAEVGELAALVRQLVHSLRKAAPGHALADRAVDYLHRKGLQGSPLRADESGVMEAPEIERGTDGELLIDWSPGRGRIVTLSLRADGRLSYAFTWDGEKAHGTAQMPPASGVLGDGEAWEQAARRVAENPRPIEEIKADIANVRKRLTDGVKEGGNGEA